MRLFAIHVEGHKPSRQYLFLVKPLLPEASCTGYRGFGIKLGARHEYSTVDLGGCRKSCESSILAPMGVNRAKP